MCQTPIDEQVRNIVSGTMQRGYEGLASSREVAIALEANQSYIDYLDWIKDNMPMFEESITIEVQGTRIKFENVEKFSDWLAEQL
jgi:hypothetical protein